MGLFDFFKSKRIEDEKFNSEQFQNEILAYALWKYKENKDFDTVKRELFNIREFDLTNKQIESVIERLKFYLEVTAINSLKMGQTWKYKTREGEEDSRVFIFKIDNFNSEIIVHSSVSNLKIPNATSVGHLPISAKAFLNSVTELEKMDHKTPKIEEGYHDWKQAFDDKKAGVFDVDIKDIIDYVENTLS